MGLTSNVTDSKVASETEYPCLKIYKGKDVHAQGLIILFYNPASGMVVRQGMGKRQLIGDYSASWSEEMFTKFYGTVELTST